jgi:hypothetical protein
MKYEITNIAHPYNQELRRIRALVAISAMSVVPGDLGGYVETEKNLSHEGNAWVFGNAQVYGNAWVSGNARVSGDARVYGDAQVCGDARVSGDASIMWISRIGSENGTLTVCTGKSGLVAVRGCFSGSLDEFAAAVYDKHGGTQIADEYALAIQMCRLRLADAQAKIDSGEVRPEEPKHEEAA